MVDCNDNAWVSARGTVDDAVEVLEYLGVVGITGDASEMPRHVAQGFARDEPFASRVREGDISHGVGQLRGT